MSLNAPLSSSYSDQLQRRRLIFSDPACRTLLTDRSNYITFLESQLDRVSSACLVVDSLSERINDLSSQLSSFDSRLNTFSKSLSSLQSQREMDLKFRVKSEEMLNSLSNRMVGLEKSISELVTRNHESTQFNQIVENKFNTYDKLSQDFEIFSLNIGSKINLLAPKNEILKLKDDISATKTQMTKILTDFSNFQQEFSAINALVVTNSAKISDQNLTIEQISQSNSELTVKINSIIESQKSIKNDCQSTTEELKQSLSRHQSEISASFEKLKISNKESLSCILSNVEYLSSIFFPFIEDTNEMKTEVAASISSLINSIEKLNKRTSYIDSQVCLKINSVISKTNDFLNELVIVNNRMNYFENLMSSENT
ncbi:hypothetical protein RCL1_007118 [Eukaryota sp. TZLM3-RCL]